MAYVSRGVSVGTIKNDLRNNLCPLSWSSRLHSRFLSARSRVLQLCMFLYTLGAALIGHRYWTLTGAEQVDSMDAFYKNLSIMGGFLLLYVTGAGKYSIDALHSVAAP